MKTKTTTMIVALTLGVFASATSAYAEKDTRAERARSYYQMGVVAMKEGKFDLAKTSFKEVLRIYPNHPQARQKLSNLTANRSSLETQKRKAALKRVIIPKVDFEKATVREALDVLAVQVERESKKKITPNFIVQDPTEAFDNRLITLRLNRVPAETLLRYIVDQASGYIRYDNHAIVITPRHKTKSAPKPDADEALIVE